MIMPEIQKLCDDLENNWIAWTAPDNGYISLIRTVNEDINITLYAPTNSHHHLVLLAPQISEEEAYLINKIAAISYIKVCTKQCEELQQSEWEKFVETIKML